MAITLNIYAITLTSWLVFEAYLLIRDLFRNQKYAKDRGTLIWLTFCIFISFYGANVIMSNLRTYIFHFKYDIQIFTAIALCGLLLRVWAVLKLGKSFQRKIIVNNDQITINSGPYKFVRHPSYLGLLLSIFGIVAFWGNVLASVFALVIVICGLYPRIILEEEFLAQNLKDYKDFILKNPWRLLPYIW